ncbi:MAG: hypothetical protein KAH12_02055, partial [Anaerolineales bacterium]|nr:hypothetical protein [Anaerolineales bacterium]
GNSPKLRDIDNRYIFLIGYFIIFFLLIVYISPYDSLRYISFLIPLFSIAVVGLLQALPDRYQVRCALLFSSFVIFFNIYGLAKVVQDELPGSALIPAWRSESVFDELGEEASIIVVSDWSREKIRPLLYHAPPGLIAFCQNRIPEDLFLREGEIVLFVDRRLSVKLKTRNIKKLQEQGCEKFGRFESFDVFRRDAADGLPE